MNRLEIALWAAGLSAFAAFAVSVACGQEIADRWNHC